MINKIHKITLLILVSSLLYCDSLFARAMVWPLEKMIEESDLIAVGTVKVIKENSWINGPTPGSTAQIETARIIKGLLKGSSVLVRYLGTTKFWVDDEPQFEINKKVLLFLKRINNNYYKTVASGNVEINIEDKVYIWEGNKDKWDGHYSMVWDDGKRYYCKVLTIDECIERIKKYMSSEGKNEKK